MPDTPDLVAAISDLDDGYLQAQLLLAVSRASREEPRRAAFWHAMAAMLAAEQQQRRQSAGLTGDVDGEAGGADMASALEQIRDELRLDAETLGAQYADATGAFPAPAGQAPLVQEDEAGPQS
ncbi:MAG: hypothetical protein ACR2MO_17775 [Acidimicrobiales bacterium]